MDTETNHIESQQPSPPSEIQFLDLIDDCIFAIFDRLTTTDICSMSFTCQRMQSVAFDHFQQKFPSETTKIIIDNLFGKTTLNFLGWGNKKHLKYFTKVIHNVQLFNLGVGTTQLYEIVKAQCPPKLKTLYIYNTAKMYPGDGEILKDQLPELESLFVRDFHPETDIYEVLMKHCKKLQKLTISSGNIGNTDWMLQRYGQLKSLEIFAKGNSDYPVQFAKNAGHFFGNNPQITNILCRDENEIASAILLNAVNIERLIIGTRSLAGIIGPLKAYCRRSTIQYLQFDLLEPSDETVVHELRMLRKLNQIHPVHGVCAQLDDNSTMDNIIGLKHLKWLNVRIFNANKSFVDDFPKKIVKEMLNLEELALSLMNHTDKEATVLKALLMPFVSHALKMDNLTVDFGFFIHFDSDDFMDLEAIFSQVPRVSPLKILIRGYRMKPKIYISKDCMLKVEIKQHYQS